MRNLCTRGNEYFNVAEEDPFFNLVRHTSNFYMIFFVIFLTIMFRWMTSSEKRRMQGIMREKRKMETELNLCLSKISHDIATPVSALVMHVDEVGDVISGKNNNYYVAEEKNNSMFFFRMMTKSSLLLECSFQNFLICCKIRNKKCMSVMKDRVNIKNYIITQIVRRLIVLKDERKCELKVVYPKADVHREVYIDLSNVNLVLMNLVINSFVHSEAKNIRIETKFINNHLVEFIIIDDGIIGIKNKKEELKNNSYCTLGLGISVHYQMQEADAINGTISFSSNNNDDSPSKGTKVTVRFPYRLYPPQQQQQQQQLNKKKKKKKKKRRISKNNRVLVIDDNPMITNYLNKFLEKEMRIEAVDVTSCEHEALYLLNKNQYGLIMTDFNLTKMTSIELFENYLSSSSEKHNVKNILHDIIIIVFTGSSVQEVMQRSEVFEGLLIDDVILKPFNPIIIRSCLEKYVLVQEEED